MSETISKRFKSLQVVPTAPTTNGSTPPEIKRSYAELLEIVRRQAADIQALQKKLETVKQDLRARDDKHEAALAEAVLAARKEEQSASEMNSAKIIEAGIESLKAGRRAYEAFLEKSEALSLSVADQALSPLFEDPIQVKATLASAIAKSIHKLGQSSVLNVRLNADDFGDLFELFALEPTLEKEKISFEVDPTLQSGESVFELLIGQYEISIPEHWASLQKLIKNAMQEIIAEDAA